MAHLVTSLAPRSICHSKHNTKKLHKYHKGAQILLVTSLAPRSVCHSKHNTKKLHKYHKGAKIHQKIRKQLVKNNEQDTLQVSLLWYGKLLEDGGPSRKAGRMPPIRPIEGWIKRKKIPVPAAFKSPENFAWAIAKSIAKKGPKFPYPKKAFIEESIMNAAANFGNEAIAAGVEADLIVDIDKVFIKSGATIT